MFGIARTDVSFVACDEGKATVLDVVHDGKQLGSAGTGKEEQPEGVRHEAVARQPIGGER